MGEYMLAAVVVFGLVAVGEVISYLTKAVIPSMAGALIIYLILIWCGMPQTFPDTVGFTTLGDMAFYMLCVGVGTGVAPGEYVRNLKSVIMALVSVICGMILCVGVGGLIFGFDTMLSGAGACCGGGAISGIAAITKLNELGMVALLGVPTIMIVTVDPIGQPIASFVLRKYAKRLSAEDAYLLERAAKVDTEEKKEQRLTFRGDEYGSPENPSPFFPAWLPSDLDKDGVVLFEMVIAVALGVWIEGLTGMSAFLWCFLLGIFGCFIGAFRLELFDSRANSSGFLYTLVIGYLLINMNGLTPSAVVAVLPAVVALIVLSAVGLGFGGYISGKFFGYDPVLSAAGGIGIMFLYPGIAIVSNEVSARTARDEEERQFIFGKIAPSMYIMGTT